MARAYVGTSGWSYQHWRDGVFYPPRLPPREWLGFLAQNMDTVELNAPFYRTPKAEYVQRWADTAPPGFRFAVKLWRGFTHYNRLDDPRGLLPSVLGAFDAFKDSQRGPLLVQLPPQMDVDAQRLGRFLAMLEPYGWQAVVEFRNDAWLAPGIVRILDEHGAALCLHDMKWAAPVEQPNRAPIVYVRRHGPSGKYRGSYTDEALAADAARITDWVAGGRDVFVYFNNDMKGHAPRNAMRLRELLGAPAPPGRPSPRRPSRPAARAPRTRAASPAGR